jgi:hypothetical protein
MTQKKEIKMIKLTNLTNNQYLDIGTQIFLKLPYCIETSKSDQRIYAIMLDHTSQIYIYKKYHNNSSKVSFIIDKKIYEADPNRFYVFPQNIQIKGN